MSPALAGGFFTLVSPGKPEIATGTASLVSDIAMPRTLINDHLSSFAVIWEINFHNCMKRSSKHFSLLQLRHLWIPVFKPRQPKQRLPRRLTVRNPPPAQKMQVHLGQEDPLEKEMATHSSVLAWETPRTEEAGGLESTGSQSDTVRNRACSQNWGPQEQKQEWVGEPEILVFN